jgi:NAD(P)H-flavin reductase
MLTCAMADPMTPAPWRVQRVRGETRDTFTLALQPANGAPVPVFAPGQFNMLYLFGVGEVPISISGDPAQQKSLLHTIRGVGTVTRPMRQLKRGAILGVRGPFGSSWPIEEARGNDVVIVSGGLGLAPLRPVLYYLLAHRERYGRIVLLYGARAPGDLLYRRALDQWQGRSGLEIAYTVDAAPNDWRGNVGVVTTLIPKARIDPANTTALICGPEVMMRYVILQLQKGGVAPKNIFISMERNMKCAIGFCGHCQFGPAFICKDGPVFRYDQIQSFFELRGV